MWVDNFSTHGWSVHGLHAVPIQCRCSESRLKVWQLAKQTSMKIVAEEPSKLLILNSHSGRDLVVSRFMEGRK